MHPSVKTRIAQPVGWSANYTMNFFQVGEFVRFFRAAVTKYQLHSPFVFDLACAVLEDKRWYYAFGEVESMRQKMLASEVALNVTDFGIGHSARPKKRSVRSMARLAGSSKEQGRMLFRMANHLGPKKMLELGTSVGIGAMYLSSAVRDAQFISLEGSPEVAQVARLNLEWMGLDKHASVWEGPFEQRLLPALQTLQRLDLVFFDGNHRPEPTLGYFEACLAYSHEKTAFVFDDMHGSAGMSEAWEQLKNHPRVTLTIDFFELSVVFIDPDFREKQHLKIVPARWKPWRFF